MHAWIKNYKLWTVVAIAAGTIFKYIQYKNRNSNQEIYEILIFNEVSGACSSKHIENKSFDCTNKYCRMRHIQRIVQHIDKAVYAIDIAMYTLTTIEIREALLQALNRGVTLRIISDPEMTSSSGSKILSLTFCSAEIRMPVTTNMMHHKFMVIDEDTRVKDVLRFKSKLIKPQASVVGVVLFGSANWTSQGFNGNWENYIITSNKFLMSQFQMEFDRMWKSFKSDSSHSKQA